MSMPSVLVFEIEAPAKSAAIQVVADLPRVPVAGDIVEAHHSGERVALEVIRVVFKEGDSGSFRATVFGRRERPSGFFPY